MAKAQYPKTVAVPEEIESQWQAYKVHHPEASLSGLVRQLLLEHFDEESEVSHVG